MDLPDIESLATISIDLVAFWDVHSFFEWATSAHLANLSNILHGEVFGTRHSSRLKHHVKVRVLMLSWSLASLILSLVLNFISTNIDIYVVLRC